MMPRRMIWLYLALAFVLVAAAVFVYFRWLAAYHFATVHSGILYRDGNRSVHEFKSALRKSGCKTVVILVDDEEIKQPIFQKELELCRRNGVEVVRIPIQLGGWPTTEQVEQFLRICDDPSKRPVLVHCAQGVRRTGMMVAAYQQTALGYGDTRTKELILRFGHSDRTVNDVKKFIEIYDEEKRVMTEIPPRSNE
jgi:protein tyrosine phosphatase (PTP) superfamily phosphohydrolase (DUF442 family)